MAWGRLCVCVCVCVCKVCVRMPFLGAARFVLLACVTTEEMILWHITPMQAEEMALDVVCP